MLIKHTNEHTELDFVHDNIADALIYPVAIPPITALSARLAKNRYMRLEVLTQISSFVALNLI